MTAAPATIEQLARDTVRIADPEVALRALCTLRLELDQLEPDLVSRALQTGATWSQIARALGISKQAAHRRHRSLADDFSSTTTGEHKILVTSEARRAVMYGREEAARLGQPSLGTEHILLGILRCQESYAVKALEKLGVTYDVALECLRATIPGVPAGSTAASERSAPVSPQARRILERSLREAVNRGDGYIGVEHLLLALLTDSRSGGVQTLEVLKVTPKQVRRQLEEEWAETAQQSGIEQNPDRGTAGAPLLDSSVTTPTPG